MIMTDLRSAALTKSSLPISFCHELEVTSHLCKLRVYYTTSHNGSIWHCSWPRQNSVLKAVLVVVSSALWPYAQH